MKATDEAEDAALARFAAGSMRSAGRPCSTADVALLRCVLRSIPQMGKEEERRTNMKLEPKISGR